LNVRNFYSHQTTRDKKNDPLSITIKAMRDESIERIFQYLTLLYPGEMIDSIYREFTSGKTSAAIKGHALELLSNTMDPDILIMVQKALEERRFRIAGDEEIQDILIGFVTSGDQWFSIVGHSLISDLKLAARWPQLAKYEDPLFSDSFKS